MNALEIDGLCKSYAGHMVLSELNLRVEPGEFTTILGGSGEGKTTLLRLLTGFEYADAGTIQISNRVVAGPHRHVPPHQRHVGYVAQEGALFPHLTVEQNVEFGLPGGRHRKQRVAEMLELIELGDFAKRRPHELSGGQQQRVALARALAPKPDVILLDEPFAALDPELRDRLSDDVRRILKEAGTTAVLVTHDQTEALSISDRIAVLSGGRIVQHDDPATVYRHPADYRTANFLGETIILHGRINHDRIETALGNLYLAETSRPRPDEATVLIRPEQIQCVAEDEPGCIVGLVDTVRFYGHDALVTITVQPLREGPLSVTARVAGHTVPTHGKRVGIRVDGTASILF